MNNITFNPTKFAFKRVNIDPPGYVVYEKDHGGLTDGNPDFLRLNVYLSQSGSFVTIWTGLFDPCISEGALKFKDSHLMNFSSQYYEVHFRGYISDNETAKTILDAVRLDNYRPSKLEVDEDERLCCNLL